jgi:hypothetical protein
MLCIMLCMVEKSCVAKARRGKGRIYYKECICCGGKHVLQRKACVIEGTMYG